MVDKDKLLLAAGYLLDAIEGTARREGTFKTVDRIVKGWIEMFDGYDKSAEEILTRNFSSDGYDQMVIISDIKVESFCEHHILPFRGKAWLGYLPDGKIVGLSKVHKLVEMFAHRLQNQERLTSQVADTFQKIVKPQGVMIVIKAFHDCMRLRGVRALTGETITSAVRGCFAQDSSIKQEFFNAIWKL